jgi:two-component system, probable response regulator PhcQ
MNCKILLVDDEPNVISALNRSLFDEPYEILSDLSGEMALETLQKNSVKVVVSDEKMAHMSGSEFLSQVKKLYPYTVRILLTGQATMKAAMRAVNEGEIYRFFSKPWDDAELKFALRSAVEKYDLEEENRRLLLTVRQQSLELKVLERRYPGISRVERDSSGNLLLPEISDEELARFWEECE